MNILSVEAWAESESFADEEIISWNWNDWHKIGECEPVSNEREAHEVFQKFFDGFDPEKYEVEDDQYNFVLVAVADRRPLYAIEYGSEY